MRLFNNNPYLTTHLLKDSSNTTPNHIICMIIPLVLILGEHLLEVNQDTLQIVVFLNKRIFRGLTITATQRGIAESVLRGLRRFLDSTDIKKINTSTRLRLRNTM